ncbi:2-C-methyl-D-erythritol 4-phosphate cytidylyltransferase [Dethiobacter alkaliphilus]|uniref:2-C-methyl-D-erythritol 4-phosphate cytidylyltransferase n=1 Tax=Dethiobacter alkaliphilus AHT 1 TaxID=555088 RepID=C0GIM2_DETAL|nr:2-C-methyl-D-erythritol 4-phosphate cytidylyltransferase [Dethiobacter alkaliphilus]EEG76883.1 2-C-methyl-D-erythritol 4-phosphate cytidylyltransferase [Dethiobacter alkaliphilus AHT 1]
MKAVAIIPAAGQGRRMGKDINKQYLQVLGKPVLSHTLAAVFAADCFTQVIVVVTPGEEEIFRRDVLLSCFSGKDISVVTGGKERQDSVFNALQSVEEDTDYISIHDGARPLIRPELFRRSLEAAKNCGAVIAAVPVKDTIKMVDSEKKVAGTPERQKLWSVQTPQVFRRDWLLDAYQRARRDGYSATDDAALLEHYGYPVHVLEGDYENIKVTTPEDLILAEALLGRREVCE